MEKLTLEVVKKVALQNYEKGGDRIVECWEDKEILEWIAEKKSDGTTKTMNDLMDLIGMYHDYNVDHTPMEGWDY